MLHTKFRGNRPAGPGEDFEGFLPLYGHGGHLPHVTSIISTNSHFHIKSFIQKEL